MFSVLMKDRYFIKVLYYIHMHQNSINIEYHQHCTSISIFPRVQLPGKSSFRNDRKEGNILHLDRRQESWYERCWEVWAELSLLIQLLSLPSPIDYIDQLLNSYNLEAD